MNINDILKALQNYLAGTSEYSAVKRAQTALSANPAVSSQVTAFRKKQEAMYSQNLPEENMRKLMSELEQDYANIRRYPEAAAYFDALERFDQMLGNIVGGLRSSLMSGLI